MMTNQEQLDAQLRQIDEIEELNAEVFKQVTKELIKNQHKLGSYVDTLQQMMTVLEKMKENQEMIVNKLNKNQEKIGLFTKYLEVTNDVINQILNAK